MYKVFINDAPLFIHNDTDFKYQNINVVNNIPASDMTPEKLFGLTHQKAVSAMQFWVNDPGHFWDEWRCQFENIDAAGGLVLGDDDSFLGIYRLGKWDLPKGKADPGESPERTALREVEEECGISGLEIQQPLTETYHVYPLKNRFVLKKTYWFSMHWDGSGILRPETEEGIEALRWIMPNERPHFCAHTYQSVKEVVENHFGTEE